MVSCRTAVRQRAVERGLLLGAHPPLNPAAGHALEPSVASSRKASPDIAAAELPPRALWERKRAAAAAAAIAAESFYSSPTKSTPSRHGGSRVAFH